MIIGLIGLGEMGSEIGRYLTMNDLEVISDYEGRSDVSKKRALNYGIKVNNRLAFLMADQQRGDYPPTDQAYQVFNELAADLDQILKEMTNLCNQNIPNLNKALNGLEAISMP